MTGARGFEKIFRESGSSQGLEMTDTSFIKKSPQKYAKIWTHLIVRFAHHTLPHALLLSGGGGEGVREFSMAFAQFLLCQCRDLQGKIACGHCHQCLLFAARTHPDFFLLEPEAHGQIKIDGKYGYSRYSKWQWFGLC